MNINSIFSSINGEVSHCGHGEIIMNIDSWLDKHIEKQKDQRAILDKITFPYSAEELCETVTEEEELIMCDGGEMRYEY